MQQRENGDILIVGGYGAVGRVIAGRLVAQFPGQAVVAGRSYDKANALAQALGKKARPLQLDVFSAHETPEVLDGVALVVMCLDQPHTRFVEMCLQNGVSYVDVTASVDFLRRVEALDGVAKSGGGTAVLSVGLAPGLTNLLARYAQLQLDEVTHLDIHVLLGLGEAHGEAAVRWMVENLNSTFTVQEDGRPKQVSSFSDGKQTQFPDGLGRRTTYRFDFPDQHVLPRTLGIPSVSSRVGFDSVMVTDLVALGKKMGLFRLLRYRRAREALVKWLTAVHFGSELFVIQVDARGTLNGQDQVATYAVTGEKEADFTGLVAAQVAERLMTADYPAGVFHIEQLFQPRPFVNVLERQGLVFHATVLEKARV